MNKARNISVIVPVYNTAAFLARCIDSIRCQTYKDLEIILVNDGSTDGSGTICDDYALKDSRIVVVHQKNRGQSVARNVGIKLANGAYLTFVDSDDWIDLDMYATMMQIMLENDLKVVECNEIHRYEDTETKPEDPANVIFENRMTALKRVIADQSFSVCKRIYHKAVLANMQFLEDTFAEDVYFSIDVVSNIEKIAVLSNPFYNYYKANESTTRGVYELRQLGTIDAAQYVESKIDKLSNDPDFKPIIDNFMLTVLLYNYKAMQLQPKVDPNGEHRRKIKKLIAKYSKGNTANFQLKLAHLLPLKVFHLLSQINKRLKLN